MSVRVNEIGGDNLARQSSTFASAAVWMSGWISAILLPSIRRSALSGVTGSSGL